MSKPNKNKIYRLSFLLIFCMLLFTALYGCGTGPDGAAGSTPTPSDSSSLTLSVPSSVTFGTPVTATAILRNASGALAQGAVVTFAASSGLVAFTPTSTTALTDVNGTASITLNAASSISDGATSITASAPLTANGTTTTITSTPVGIAVHGTTDLSSLTLGVTSNIVAWGAPVTATATLRDADGHLLQNAIVTFTAESGIVVFTPTATALTDSHGNASVTLNPAAIDSDGATSITASAPLTANGTTTTITSTPVGIAVNAATVTLGALTLGQPSISAYGTSSLSIPVYLNGVLTTTPISVAFTSPCVSLGKATLTSPVTTILGTAASTYKDNNCASGTDVITASVTGATASATITVAIPAVSNIQFVSATPAIIGTKTVGAATLSKSSIVKFQVVDSSNNGKAGVLVDFSLVPASAPGGIILSPASATSDVDGYVTTSVTSGTVPTPVWVVAKVHSTPAIVSQSNTLTITTGLPTQNFFSLAVSTFNIEGLSVDNVSTNLTIIASDRMGNPVPDGTAINFITPESGQIIPASCTMVSGTCTVRYLSEGSRPANGRVTILAYAVGEKSFVDANGDNIYNAGETFYDLGDLYVDSNENGTWDPGEQYIITGSGTQSCLTRPSGASLPASYGNVPSKDNTCDKTWGINYVRRSAVIVLSGSVPTISTTPPTSPITVSMLSHCYKTFDLLMEDINGNPMPVGTTVTVPDVTNNVYYTPNGSTTAAKVLTPSIIYGTPVGNTANAGGTSFTLLVDADCTAGTPVVYPHGSVDIVAQSPLGAGRAFTITVNP